MTLAMVVSVAGEVLELEEACGVLLQVKSAKIGQTWGRCQAPPLQMDSVKRFLTPSLREVVKKRPFYGQADRKG